MTVLFVHLRFSARVENVLIYGDMERIVAVNAKPALQHLIVIICAAKVSSAISVINAVPDLVYLEYALFHDVLIVILSLQIGAMQIFAVLTPNATDIASGDFVQVQRFVLLEFLIILDAMASTVT